MRPGKILNSFLVLIFVLFLCLSANITNASAQSCFGCDDFPASYQYIQNPWPYVGAWGGGIVGSSTDVDSLKFSLSYANVTYDIEAKSKSANSIRMDLYDSSGYLLYSSTGTSNKFSYFNETAGTIIYMQISGGTNTSYKFRSLPWFSVYPIVAYAQEAGLTLYEPGWYDKSLLFLDAGVFEEAGTGVGMKIYLDLADYTGITGEGQQGWVTVWGLFTVKGGLDLSDLVSPVAIGVTEKTTGGLPYYGDDDLSGGSIGKIDLPMLSFTLIDSDNGGGYSYYAGAPRSTSMFGVSGMDLDFSVVKFEIRRDVLDGIFSSYFLSPSPITDAEAAYLIVQKIYGYYQQGDSTLIRAATETDEGIY